MSARTLAGTILAAGGLAAVAFSLALVARGGTADVTTYGGASTSFTALEAVTGVALLAAAPVLLAERSGTALGLLTLAAGLTWFAPVWTGWEGGPAVVRSVGLVAAPLLPAFVLAIAAGLPPTPPSAVRRPLDTIAAVGVGLTAALSVATALVRDPIRDLYCWSDCTANAFLVRDDAALARKATVVVLVVTAACALLAALVSIVRLFRASSISRRAAGAALFGCALAGSSFAAYAGALWYVPREDPDRALYRMLFLARSAALLVLAGGLLWLAVRPRLVRGLATRLAVDLERAAGEGGLAPVLARVLGDRDLRLGYPIGPGDRVVDAEGRPLALGRQSRVTAIVGEAGPVALVESATTNDVLERELGPAVRLALGNERLRAEALARLADATGSRARIVETADATRRSMERDLHDGAQQRMLALIYDLRIALEIAEGSGRARATGLLREALARAIGASRDLRDVAHGIFPAELATSGLGAALELLADVRPLTLAVGLPEGRRYAPEVEATVYAVVAEATEESVPVDVELTETDGALRVAIAGPVEWGRHLVRLEDRLAVAGGSARVIGTRFEATLPMR